MIISIYGAGYVGLITAACLAKLEHQVTCVDIDTKRIAMLRKGQCPVYEAQLPELISEAVQANRLHFTDNFAEATKRADIHFIATGTPSLPEGNANISQIIAVAVTVAQQTERDCLLVIKSTVPVGTGDALQVRIDKELLKRRQKIRISVAANPEFLREGSAVHDFMNAERIIIGGKAQEIAPLQIVYHPLVAKNIPLLSMSRRSAELAKYAANVMLACRVSFINQISQLAGALGANIDEVRQGIALDTRIGPHFLRPGIGYGGSCFPKDISALVYTAKALQIDASLIEAIAKVNQLQKNWLIERLQHHFNNKLAGLKIGIWGLAFKPGTDDLRDASSLVAMKSLLAAKAKLIVFDPAALLAAQKLFINEPAIRWCETATEVLTASLDALLIATEWPEFRNFNLHFLSEKLNKAPLIDGRNCFTLEQVKQAGVAYYYSVGRPQVMSRREIICA